ncbi:hypothetical protein [Methylosinus sp. PW1]|uniref:hypothetical protein n=1 Tax=Methylosinus sp. PW1 TaxID=107636 RepID=UPI0018DE75E0|nr:hypothetical protein [Methylosinus sp. PW1]
MIEVSISPLRRRDASSPNGFLSSQRRSPDKRRTVIGLQEAPVEFGDDGFAGNRRQVRKDRSWRGVAASR